MLLFLPRLVEGQQLVDKLANQYHSSKVNDPSKFYKAGKYAQALFFNQQPEKAIQLLEENLQQAQRFPDSKYAAHLCAILAMNNRILDREKESKRYIEHARVYAEKTTHKETKGYVSYCRGWLHARSNQQAEAVRQFLNALQQYDNAQPSESLLTRKASTLGELTAIYANWKEYELQEKYGKQALEIAIKLQDPAAIFEAYMMMGYLHEQQYVGSLQDDKLQTSERYYLKAIETYQKNKQNMVVSSNLSFAAINLANLYLHYFPDTYREKAIAYAEMALAQAQQSEQFSQVASAYGILADISIKNGNPERAKDYLLASLTAVNHDPLLDQTVVMSIYQHLSKIYEEEKNLPEALRYYKSYNEVFTRVYDTEKLEQGRRLEAQFEKERQQQQLLRMALESQQKEQQLSLMHVRTVQQQQLLQNMRLNEENQRKELELAHLEGQKKEQQLKLSRLEAQKREQEVLNFQNTISYKEKLNRYYGLLAAAFLLLLILLLYAYLQRAKGMQQQQKLHALALEQERQNSQISNLTAMLDGQEQERGRLARDLHDGLGGILSSTKLNLSHRIEKMNSVEKLHMQDSLLQLDSAVNELRRVAHNLMPDLLIKYGLQEVLQDYAKRMENDNLEIDVHFLHYTQRLSTESQLLVYRIIQELVNNAIKHAEADQLLIQLVEENNRIYVTIEDNGKGFDMNAIEQKKSAGLHNIQSRVQFLKGQLNIQSELNLGTTIEFDFPIQNTTA